MKKRARVYAAVHLAQRGLEGGLERAAGPERRRRGAELSGGGHGGVVLVAGRLGGVPVHEAPAQRLAAAAAAAAVVARVSPFLVLPRGGSPSLVRNFQGLVLKPVRSPESTYIPGTVVARLEDGKVMRLGGGDCPHLLLFLAFAIIE